MLESIDESFSRGYEKLTRMGGPGEAMEMLTSSLKRAERDSNLFEQAIILNILAGHYLMQGEVTSALDWIRKAVVLFDRSISDSSEEREKRNRLKSWSYAIWGDINRLRGNTAEAVKNFETGLDFARDSGDYKEQAKILLAIIATHVIKGDLQEATKNLAVLEEIREAKETEWKNLDSESINVIEESYQYSLGRILKASNRSKETARAELIFEKIVEKREFMSGIRAYALSHLLELRLIEYRTFNQPEVLVEIYAYLDDLDLQVVANFSGTRWAHFHIKGLIIKSKLHIIQGDFVRGNEVLQDAIDYTERKSMKLLNREALMEKKVMIATFDEMRKLIQVNASISDLMDKIEILDYVKRAQEMVNQ